MTMVRQQEFAVHAEPGMNGRSGCCVTSALRPAFPRSVSAHESYLNRRRSLVVSGRGGSALLVVMWALILLSMAVIAWAKFVQQGIALYGEANLGLDARALALSGVAVGLHPLVSRGTPILERRFDEDRGYSVKMVSEGGKLNIKRWFDGEDPRKIDLFKRWLEQRGMELQEREVFVDSLLDYIDPDTNYRLNGVEERGDYRAANRELESLDEIARIPGSEPLVNTPGWKESLTLYSQGNIDLLSAEPDILRLIPGFDDTRIQLLLNLRRGKDGIEGTADDPQIQSIDQLLKQYLGFNQLQIKSLSGMVMINDKTMRITSTGQVGEVIRQVEVIARKPGGNPQIISWKE